MKAFIVDRYGSSDSVRAGEMPDAELRDDDVLIQIHAASINPLDLKIRDGKLKLVLRYRLPLILGNDLAGVDCNPAGEASWRHRGDDNEHGECRLGEGPRCRCGHRLKKRRFRSGAARLRRGPGHAGGRGARKVPAGAEARREAGFHCRST